MDNFTSSGKHFYPAYGCSWFFLFLFVFLCSFPCTAENAVDYNMAFYYGTKPPLDKLRFYKNIIVQPYSTINPLVLQSEERTIYAYTSLGEAADRNAYGKPIHKSWVIGKNEKWKTLVLDQSNPEWQLFFLNQVITPLWEKGYRGFFLDTLDSYRIASEDPKLMKKQQDGIISTIRAIKNRYPDAKLILNRGFEVIPQIGSLVDGVIAESLFYGWNNRKKEYFVTSREQREPLLKELLAVKQMGIPVTVVDYIAPEKAGNAKMIARQIADQGFRPWVTNDDMTKLYLFDINFVPRKILLLYQGKLGDVDEKIGSYTSGAVSMPLNHMGYVTVLRNTQKPLPHNISAQEYAGVVVATGGPVTGREQEFHNWYKELIQKKIPLLILGSFGFSPDNQSLKMFGLSMPAYTFPSKTIRIIYKSPMTGYEIPPFISSDTFIPVKLEKGISLIKAVDELGTTSDMAGITPWGGYSLTDTFLLPKNYWRWVLDPFKFLKQALKLRDQPVPDTTTENGKRLMMVHIDGDGFANRGQWHKAPFVGDVMRQEFLEYYPVPTTVSVIQGEIAAGGLHPDIAPQLEERARKIFALPNVEIASHTFSHPFNWHDAENYKGNKPNPFTLKIPGYRFNLYSEVIGSVEYIDKNLAPPGKKCKVFLWSGEGDVPEKALKYAYESGLANLNPGKLITNSRDSLTNVSSLGLFEGPWYQVFAPIGNDYETVGSDTIFYSLINIIDSLKLTDKPRRLKPIDIYLHFFTVAEKGGIKALHKVYNWALSQSVMNIYVSDYFNKVKDFNDLKISKTEGGWLIATNDYLREFRMPKLMGYPDLVNSKNIIGYSFYNDDCYIHIGPGGEAFLKITSEPARLPFLKEANARVTHFRRNNRNIDFSLEGYLPLEFTFANMDNCTLWNGRNQIQHQFQGDNHKRYAFKQGNKYDLSIKCE